MIYHAFNAILLLLLAPAVAATAPASRTVDPLVGRLIEMADGYRTRTVRVDAVEIDPKDRDGDTYLYTVSYQNPGNGRWQNLCRADSDGVSKAIALIGHWDASGRHLPSARITFACTSGVLAKCVRWGYKPWRSYHGRSLRPLHQTCTRMARADYCGDGRSHTKDGTPIIIFDVFGVQRPAKVDGMRFEAAWGPAGALALARGRFAEADAIIAECPDRLAGRQHRSAPRASLEQLRQLYPDALLFNESYPNQH